MTIEQKIWGKSPEGKDLILYTITNAKGNYIQLSNLGAGIVSIVVPDKEGKLTDVILGYDKAESYFGDGPCAGKCPGRYANRIAKGKFSLEGKEFSLPINNGPNHLHGGNEGFQNQVWDSRVLENSVEFMYFSEDGEAGYPGNLKAVVHYEWSEDNSLKISFTAKCDAPTIINLTNHAYFNLNGEGNGDILKHELKLNSSEYLPTNETLIPTGNLDPVASTPMDFINTKELGKDIKADFPAIKFGKGYDACFAIDGWKKGQIDEAAELYSAQSGIKLNVYTTQPGIQIYTGNWLSGCPIGKKGHIYNDYDGVAMECQHFPDSPNRKDFPTTILRPEEVFEEAIIFAFSIK